MHKGGGSKTEKPKKYSDFDFKFSDMQTIEDEFRKIIDQLLKPHQVYTALGIDGCKYGWVAVSLDSMGNFKVHLMQNIHEILTIKADVYLADIPIGFMDTGTEERACEKPVRKRLGKRASSVFPVPVRKAIYADTYEDAVEINNALTGKKFAKQAWGIVPKMRQVDEFLQKHMYMTNCLLESHPELCFCELMGNPCEHYKKDPLGEKERMEMLRKFFPAERLFEDYQFPKKQVGTDDIIDAAVLAVTGILGLQNGFKSIPENPATDSLGLEMKMMVANIGKV